MGVAADAVGDHGADPQLRIETLEAQHDGRGTPRLARRVDHEHHGRIEPLRDLGRRAVLARAVDAVEAAHHALDHDEVGVDAVAGDGCAHRIATAHPPVEIVGRTPRDQRMEAGIDEVGADLERLDREPAPPEGLEQTERHGGLAHHRCETPATTR